MLGGHGCTLDLRVSSSPRGPHPPAGTQHIAIHLLAAAGLAADPLWDSSSACGCWELGCVWNSGSAPAKGSSFFFFSLCSSK